MTEAPRARQRLCLGPRVRGQERRCRRSHLHGHTIGAGPAKATCRGLEVQKVRGAARQAVGSACRQSGSSVAERVSGITRRAARSRALAAPQWRGFGNVARRVLQPLFEARPTRAMEAASGLGESVAGPARRGSTSVEARSGRTQRIPRAHVSIRRLQIEARGIEPAPAEEEARRRPTRGRSTRALRRRSIRTRWVAAVLSTK